MSNFVKFVLVFARKHLSTTSLISIPENGAFYYARFFRKFAAKFTSCCSNRVVKKRLRAYSMVQAALVLHNAIPFTTLPDPIKNLCLALP